MIDQIRRSSSIHGGPKSQRLPSRISRALGTQHQSEVSSQDHDSTITARPRTEHGYRSRLCSQRVPKDSSSTVRSQATKGIEATLSQDLKDFDAIMKNVTINDIHSVRMQHIAKKVAFVTFCTASALGAVGGLLLLASGAILPVASFALWAVAEAAIAILAGELVGGLIGGGLMVAIEGLAGVIYRPSPQMGAAKDAMIKFWRDAIDNKAYFQADSAIEKFKNSPDTQCNKNAIVAYVSEQVKYVHFDRKESKDWVGYEEQSFALSINSLQKALYRVHTVPRV